jgi:hypothetical protein
MTFRRAGGCLALTVALVCAASAQSGVQADKQFQGALHKENVDGDLKAAIEEYRKISTRPGVGRELAATSLVRMAECYRKLGDAQARQIYAQVVREFADQPIAGEARTQLAAMGAPVSGANPVVRATGDRVVWAGLGVFSEGRVSPDGRFVSNTDWATNFSYNLTLRDPATDIDRQLTSDEDQGGNAWSSTFSPDGKQLAYGWRTYGEPHVDEPGRMWRHGIPQPRRVRHRRTSPVSTRPTGPRWQVACRPRCADRNADCHHRRPGRGRSGAQVGGLAKPAKMFFRLMAKHWPTICPPERYRVAA